MSESLDNNLAETWFAAAAWKNGLVLEADSTTDVNEFYRQYHANKDSWDRAFAFLKDQDLDLIAAGKYPIDGDNVFASVSDAPNLDFEKTPWESHRKYNDIQYVIRGKERIGITTADKAEVTVEYDESKDISFYTAEGPIYDFQPHKFFIFFPHNLHRPGIKVEDDSPVKKIVLKIRTS